MEQPITTIWQGADSDVANPIVERALAERSDQIISAYSRRIGLSSGRTVSADMIRTHYYTERRLARSILAASKHERAAAARRAYTEFYATCFWLDAWRKQETEAEQYVTCVPFLNLLRRYGPNVYEVGSGGGNLARFLNARGFAYVATEISDSRPVSTDDTKNDLVWHVSDGVRLSQYEPVDHFDAVVSSQVIEHLHPDDAVEHFANALAILRPGGAYVFDTPHRFSGPRDISELFGLQQSECFHLREYTYGDFAEMLNSVGFRHLSAAYVVPRSIRAKLGGLLDRPIVSSAYLSTLIALESVLQGWRPGLRKRVVRAASAIGVWRPNVFLVAVK